MCPERYGLLVTCEHGGNQIPPRLADLFSTADPELASHRGWDPGALALAEEIAQAFGAPLVASTTSRLVVDLNRARRSRTLFSEFTRGLPDRQRQALLDEHYEPYRSSARKELSAIVRGGRLAVHLSVHSFTPVLRGSERRADVGLLYDPSRGTERELCLRWVQVLWQAAPALRVRRNYPYRGTADGLTTCLRREFPPESYLGVELEVNQRLATAGAPAWPTLRRLLCETFAAAVRGLTQARAGEDVPPDRR